MKRRQFLRQLVLAGACAAWRPFNRPAWAAPAAAPEATLAVATGSSPARVVGAAMEALGGIGRFVSRGDVVVVKPNIGWDRTPEYAANTNPEVVAAVVRLCRDAGASKVRVFDHAVVDPRRCYRQSGIADAAKAAGAEVSFIDERKFRDVKLPGLAVKTWPLYVDALEADRLINLPIAKTHGIAGLTLGMKNLMGIMGGWRGRIHQRIDEALVDVALTVRPTLVILDAIRILTANGPQGGELSDVRQLNTIVAGVDQVAVDAYGSTLFGRKYDSLGCVRIAQRAGLGAMDPGKIGIRSVTV